MKWTTVVVTLIATALLSGCDHSVNEQAPPASVEPLRPPSLREADPCSFLPESSTATYGLHPGQLYKGEVVRSCMWPAETFSVGVYINWDPQVLVNFSQAYPLPAGEAVLDDVAVFLQKSSTIPACGMAFLAERGTVIEVVSGDQPPATADRACDRVKKVGTEVIRRMREQGVLDTASTAAPTTR
ncbi:DUF3558 family protein [Amycolatopsis sp. MEPSY49]|uniref:DUF3558 family protein n=1 Tax=Amycolatopsis sp. MEPSY49 TaxID=3151600 RepID=UPI003EFA387A